MTFLAPYWLFSAFALLIPIAIHLWNKRQGKTVKVGSLRWLEASASKRWSSIKLNNVWLLLLRCLILLLLAVALAQPVIMQQPQAPDARKAIYIGPELLYTAATRSQLASTIDTLLQRGFQLYTYTPAFTEITPEQWHQLNTTATDSSTAGSANYWALLPTLAERHPQPQDSVWLFTSDQQRYFAGSRPATIPENIRWLPLAIEATSTWLQAAVHTSPDSLLLVFGNSTRNGTTYSRHVIPVTAKSITVNNQQLPLQHLSDTLQAVLPDKSSSPVRVQAKPLQVALLADAAQQPELRYLQAALRAISSYTRLPIHTITAPDTASDWVFWLRKEKVPQHLQQRVATRGLRLWVQPAANPTRSHTRLASATEVIPVHQTSAIASDEAQHPVWTAANGEALLTVQPLGKGQLYRFRSGFAPDWSGLGQSSQLPDLLLPLLFPQPSAGAHDMRALDETQLIPSRKAALTQQTLSDRQRRSLLPWVVLAAFLLFLMERVIAGRQAKV
ncbi:BatA domain-containing protein [Pontibacter sp. CAU 1760]